MITIALSPVHAFGIFSSAVLKCLMVPVAGGSGFFENIRWDLLLLFPSIILSFLSFSLPHLFSLFSILPLLLPLSIYSLRLSSLPLSAVISVHSKSLRQLTSSLLPSPPPSVRLLSPPSFLLSTLISVHSKSLRQLTTVWFVYVKLWFRAGTNSFEVGQPVRWKQLASCFRWYTHMQLATCHNM